jgi:hypothetical protein
MYISVSSSCMISLGLADKCDGSDDLSFQIWSVPKLGKFVRWTQGHKHFSQFNLIYFFLFFSESDLNSESKKKSWNCQPPKSFARIYMLIPIQKIPWKWRILKRNLLGFYNLILIQKIQARNSPYWEYE